MPRSWRKFKRIISYLRRYVKGFAKIASLKGLYHTSVGMLRGLLKGFAKIAKPLKGLLGRHPCLYLDDFSEPCCLEVDASFKGFRATLSQKVVGRKIVLAYASRGLRKHEKTMRNGRH